MRPLIVPGDHIEIRAGGVPRRGEVWAFCNAEGEVIAHRCRRVTGTTAVFGGDRFLRADGAIAVDCLVGRVTAVLRAGRRRPLGRFERHGRGLAAAIRRSLRARRPGL